ncbi:MAG TPA: hypothetical protein DD387_08905 [Lachnoclostridium sp.]|nr:hypothetical protein [Lachnoclostridium sp.]
MKFVKSKIGIFIAMLSIVLLLAVCWLCFYRSSDKKMPDGTLVQRTEWKQADLKLWKECI